MPVPSIWRPAPSTLTSTVSASLDSTAEEVWCACKATRPGLRYSAENASHICAGVTSPPSASVRAWTTRENSIWSRRGRSIWCSAFMMKATPPFPDWELTLITAS